MRLNDWLMALVIIIIFCGLMVFSQVSGKLDDIKKNWHLYKCNPLMIPFAGYVGEDPGKTFSSCVVSASSGFVQTALTPLTQVFDSITTVASKQEESTNNARKASTGIRSKLSGLGSSMFGVIFSFSTEVSRLGIKIKDTMNKMAGVIATMVHVLSTSMDTMTSIWKGPPGQTLRFVGGMCFKDDTLVQLSDGVLKKIKDISIGDVLKDGSMVMGTMNLLNKYNNNHLDDLYVFKNKGDNHTDIYVTGSHLVKINDEEFVPVRCHPESSKCVENEDKLVCLITNTHVIPVGCYVFGDWEDNGELPDEIKYVSKKIKRDI